MGKIIRMFFLIGIPCGLAAGVLIPMAYRDIDPVRAGITVGVLFGLILTLTLSYWQVKAVRRVSANGSALDVAHDKTLEINLPLDQAFDLCLASLQAIRNCKVKSEDRASGRLEARVGISWETWGDNILFQLEPKDDHRTQVNLSSRPAMRVTQFDMAKNLQNVTRIADFLNANSSARA